MIGSSEERIESSLKSSVWSHKTFFGILVRDLRLCSLVAQTVKCHPAMQETWARSLGQEDRLEKEIATHSSILAWRIPWTEEPGGLQSMGSQRDGHD